MSRQATCHIKQSPDSGGEVLYVQWDTRLVLRIRHPVGAQGRQRCCVGNFPEARPALGEVPETLCPTGVKTSGEMEVRGIWVHTPGET